MRLSKVHRGHAFFRWIVFPLVERKIHHTVPDVIRTLFYRGGFFGRRWDRWSRALLRGTSSWSVSERELFAAFTSRCNQCLF